MDSKSSVRLASERQGQRFDVSIGVILRAVGVSEPVLSHNVSRTGMFVGTRRAWPVGTVVDVTLVAGDARPHAKARVVSQNPRGIGLSFVDAGDDFLNTIDASVAACLARGQRDPNGRISETGAVKARWRSLTPPTGTLARLMGGAFRKVRVVDLGIDGAAFAEGKPPEAGSEIIIGFEHPTSGELLESSARVIRHTDSGFAVQFVSPSQEFRRCVTELRRAAREGLAELAT